MGVPGVIDYQWLAGPPFLEAAVRSRRAFCCNAMEGGGGSGNKTSGGLAGFFGAGGAGYSHADLAGVPRKYRA